MSLVIACQTITPMFLTGYDGVTPELRPSSIKAALRFWWRAVQAEGNLEKLKANEAARFGSSDENIGRSKVEIRIEECSMATEPYRILPRGDKQYGKYNNKQEAFKPEENFTIRLNLTEENIESGKSVPFDERRLQTLFEVVVLLGGFGKRSRRGFGSVQIAKIGGIQVKAFDNQNEINNKISGLLEELNTGSYECYQRMATKKSKLNLLEINILLSKESK